MASQLLPLCCKAQSISCALLCADAAAAQHGQEQLWTWGSGAALTTLCLAVYVHQQRARVQQQAHPSRVNWSMLPALLTALCVQESFYAQQQQLATALQQGTYTPQEARSLQQQLLSRQQVRAS